MVQKNRSVNLYLLIISVVLLVTFGSVAAHPLAKGYSSPSSNKTSEAKTVNVSSLAMAYQLSGDVCLTRHTSLNGGRIEGNVRQLTGEAINLNSGFVLTGDIIIAGTPNININGNPTYNGTVVGTGASTPSGYSININSGVTLRHIMTRTDPITFPTVGTPTAPTGNQNIVLNAGQSAPNFSQLRDLTVNSSYGSLTVPPGNYGNFSFNNGDTLVLGIAGQNSTYNLQSLVLNSTSNLQILGNVTVNILNQVNVNGGCTVGSATTPTALAMNITNGGLTLNSGNTNFYGIVKTNGNVIINGNTRLKGTVVCDRLTLNSQGLLQGLTSDTQLPVVNITSPTDGAIIRAAQTNVTGSYSDDSAVTLKVNNVNASTITATTFTVNNVPLTLGTNTLTATATDVFGNTTQSSITVYRADATNQAPVVSTGGASQTITLPSSATLNGTATDDGLPANSSLSITWSKVSGPGIVTFANPNSAQTTATFSVAGTYVLKLTASDGQLPASAMTTITVNPASTNVAPTVNAGTDQNITLGQTASLVGIVTDDNLPDPPAQTIVNWSKISGPGTVNFSNPNSLTTSASFSATGTYTLRLTASDSALSGSDDVVVVVSPVNTAPTVSAGQNQNLTFPQVANLVGTVADDGLPTPPGQVSLSWSKVSVPTNGTVTFSAPTSLTTTATFSIAGTYVLRLTASDSALSATSDVTITIAPANTPPVVNAGQSQSVVFPANITITGSYVDDGLPSGGTVSATWSQISGPPNATITFGDTHALSTTATFSEPGQYRLRLTVSDGELSGFSEVVVTQQFRPKIVAYSGSLGFIQSDISNKAGEYTLVIENNTSLDNLTYVLTQGTQSQTLTVNRATNGYIYFTLTTADPAILTVTGHPWTLTITGVQ